MKNKKRSRWREIMANEIAGFMIMYMKSKALNNVSKEEEDDLVYYRKIIYSDQKMIDEWVRVRDNLETYKSHKNN